MIRYQDQQSGNIYLITNVPVYIIKMLIFVSGYIHVDKCFHIAS